MKNLVILVLATLTPIYCFAGDSSGGMGFVDQDNQRTLDARDVYLLRLDNGEILPGREIESIKNFGFFVNLTEGEYISAEDYDERSSGMVFYCEAWNEATDGEMPFPCHGKILRNGIWYQNGVQVEAPNTGGRFTTARQGVIPLPPGMVFPPGFTVPAPQGQRYELED